MPRNKGPEKAQIRLRVRKELAEYATEKGAAWLESLIDAYRLLEIEVGRKGERGGA